MALLAALSVDVEESRGVAVKLNRNRSGRADRQATNPAVKDAGVIEVFAPKHLPQVIKCLKRSGLSKDHQVEQAVILTRLGGKRQPKRVTRQIEDKHGRSLENFLSTRIVDPSVIGGNL